MPIERAPAIPVSPSYIPKGGTPYRVKNGDDWNSVGRHFNVSVATLLEFNFKTRNPDEVNWYLNRRVGCRKATRDGKNWMFSSDASPGVIYIPPATRVVPERIVHSAGTMSWIDPRLYDAEDLPEVDKHPPPWTVQKDAFTARTGYRFANFLEGYVVPSDEGAIDDYGFTSMSGLYYGPSFRKIMPEAFDVIRSKTIAADRTFVTLVQTVGCKTVSPETIGALEAARTVDKLLGIHPNWGGPLGVQAEQFGADVGRKVAENIRVFPPIWTELELRLHADGNFESRLVRYSLFPSLTFYDQRYTVERITTDVSTYYQVQTYDARRQMNRWRSSGWGVTRSTSGPSEGNPWGRGDPRIFPGKDVPGFLAPGMPSE